RYQLRFVTPRRWTVLIVPHGSDSPRQFEIGERGVRVAAGLLGTGGLVLLAALVLLLSPWATPGGRIAARANLRLEKEVAQMYAALDQLGDSIEMLANREAQFRQLAGIGGPDTDQAAERADSASPTFGRAGLAERPKPFASFFGNRSRRADVDALLKRASELSSAFASVSDSM